MDSKTKKSVVAAATIAGLALSLVGVYYAGDRLGPETHGPSEVALAPDGTVWVSSHGGLHHFAAGGERKEVVALSALGRGPILSEVVPLSDGTLVIAEAVPSAAFRCEVRVPKCTSITWGVERTVGATTYSLMVAVDEERQRYYVSDNAGHRLILIDFDGKVLGATDPRRVVYPNELMLEKSGELVVVDTNHRRLVRMGVGGDVFGPDLWEMKTSNELLRTGRYLPMDLARSPDGGWWVLIAREGMRDADLVLFGGDGRALKRVDLGPDSDPTRIASVPGGLLVADPTGVALTRVSAKGESVAPWGDPAFQAELDGLRASRSLWRNLRLAAQVLVAVFPLLGIWALWRLGERLPVPARAAVPETPLPVSGGIRWLEVLPEFRKRGRKLAITMLVMVGGMSIVMLYVFESTLRSFSPGMQLFFLGTLALMVLAPVILLVRPPRSWRTRLGTDGRQFLLDLGDGKVRGYAFDALVTDGRQLLAGRRLIPLRFAAGPLFGPGNPFDEKDLAGYVLARIPPSNRVSAYQLFVRALRAGNRETRWGIALLVAIVVLSALPEFFPEAAADLKKTVREFLGEGPAR